MALFPSPAGNVRHHAAHAQDEAAPWVEKLARFGYAAKGVVYVLVGALAVLAAFGEGGTTTGSRGALGTVADEPFGRVLLGAIAIGLVGYVIWRLVQATMDPEDRGTDKKGIGKRIGFVISAVLYGGLAFEAARLALNTGGSGSGGGGQGGGNGPDDWTAMVMEFPLGRWIIGAVGAAIVGYGLYRIYKAFAADIAKRWKLNALNATTRDWVVRISRFGMFARGIVFGMIGYFLIQAALQYDPQEAIGLDGALDKLRGQSYGPWLLGLVAFGLVAYGISQLVKARYRRINPA